MSDRRDPVEAIGERFSDAVISSYSFRGDDTVVVERDSIHDVAEFLKEEPGLRMNFLMDLSAVDYSTFGKTPERGFFSPSGVAVRPSPEISTDETWPGPPGEARFAVVYHFFSTLHRHRVRIVAPVPEEAPEVDTLTDLWAGADWLEREVWDMFGIDFRGHPDLRRILMYEEFDGHPLRKDYPVKKRQPLVERERDPSEIP